MGNVSLANIFAIPPLVNMSLTLQAPSGNKYDFTGYEVTVMEGPGTYKVVGWRAPTSLSGSQYKTWRLRGYDNNPDYDIYRAKTVTFPSAGSYGFFIE